MVTCFGQKWLWYLALFLGWKTPLKGGGPTEGEEGPLKGGGPSEINDVHACGKEDDAPRQPARGAAARSASLESEWEMRIIFDNRDC